MCFFACEQGLANRRVGVTAMNNESSRSHSVFTCVIESRFKVLELSAYDLQNEPRFFSTCSPNMCVVSGCLIPI